MVGETATQTLTNKTFAPASISPGSNGQVMTTVSGVAAWAPASGGASISVGDTPPATPSAGALWWNSVLGTMFIYYNAERQFDAVGASGTIGGQYGRKPTVTGSRGGNAALASLLSGLASIGLITDSSTA